MSKIITETEMADLGQGDINTFPVQIKINKTVIPYFACLNLIYTQ